MILINVIYNLQYFYNSHSWTPIFQCFIRSNQIILNYFTSKWMKPRVFVQWKKEDIIGIIRVPAKKLILWFQKRETGHTLTQTCTTFSNFLFFPQFWTKFSFFAPISCFFSIDLNINFLFLPYSNPFLQFGLKPWTVSDQFHRNCP